MTRARARALAIYGADGNHHSFSKVDISRGIAVDVSLGWSNVKKRKCLGLMRSNEPPLLVQAFINLRERGWTTGLLPWEVSDKRPANGDSYE